MKVSLTCLLIDIASWKVCIQPILRIFVCVVVCQATLFLYLIIFIVAGVNDNRRMMTNALDLCDALGLDRVSERFDRSWVVSATEHEILPDEDAQLITGIVEDVFFPNTTTPDSAKSQLLKVNFI